MIFDIGLGNKIDSTGQKPEFKSKVFPRCFPSQSGEIDVVNHTTGDRCHLKFAPYSYFSRDVARKVRTVCLSHGSEQQAVTGSTYACALMVSPGDRCGDGQER